jgi:photosystem II stability/assembly factor-like uncharacterized protein
MSTHVSTFLFVVFALLAALSPEGLLAETEPNGAGNPPIREVAARSLAIDPTNPAVVFAGNFDGIYESRDGGESWKGPLPGSPRTNVIAIDPTDRSTLYAAGHGVHKSTDGGKTWTNNSPEGAADFIAALLIDPNDARRIFSSNEKIFRSPDGTKNWELLLRMEDNVASYYYPASAAAIAVAPSDSANVYAGGEAHYSEGYVSRSLDGGTTWSSPVFLYAPVTKLVVDSRRAGIVYAGTMNGFYRSADGGASWSESGLSGMYISSLVRDPGDSAALFAGTSAGVFWTGDSGSTWTRFEAVPLENVRSLALDNSGRFLYVGTERDVFRFKRKVIEPSARFVSTDRGRAAAHVFPRRSLLPTRPPD